jgi:sporulation protein YlmC with PRC-barrel domain
MKILQTVSCGVVSFSLFFTTAVLAQEQAREEAPAAPSHAAVQEQATPPSASQTAIPLTTSKPAQQSARLSSSALIGTVVKNTQGEELGKIQELMIDPQSGRISSAVLSFGGVLGMNEKRIEIPWDTLRVGLAKKELIVEMDKEQLQPAPSTKTAQQ